MTDSEWLAVAAFWPSVALAFAGYRVTRVGMFKDWIKKLEHDIQELRMQQEECDGQVRRLRQDNEWLQEEARRRTGVRSPRWSAETPKGETP